MTAPVADDELSAYALLRRVAAMPPRDRWNAYWAMSRDTMRRIAELNPNVGGVGSWQTATLLWDLPIWYDESAEGADLRTSERPKYTPLDEGEAAVYRTCVDPTCPRRRVGYEHAHLVVEREADR